MFKTSPQRTMLWVPQDRRLPSERTAKGYLEFIGVTLSYRQVYGTRPAWEDLVRALAPYSFERIVDIVCRVSASLYGATLPWDSKTQLQICQGIFGQEEATRILNTAMRVDNRMKQDGGGAPLLIFHEQQALNLLKAAFIIKGLDEKDKSDDLISLGKAFLIVTDLTEGEPGHPSAREGQDGFHDVDRWVRYLLANSLFWAGSVGSYAMVRCYDLYLTDKPALLDCGSYVNLPANLTAITGLEPTALWALTFGLSSYWATLTRKEISSEPMAVNRASHFSENFSFDDEEIEALYAFCETDVRTFKKAVEQRYSGDGLRPFDILPFAKWPLVSFDERVYTVSVIQLMQKLTTGLHHIYLDASISAANRQRYLTYMGNVFGDYVDRSLRRVFPPPSARYINLDDLRSSMVGKYCDGIISYGDAVVLIETKASLFTLEARVGHDVTAIKRRLEDIVIDGTKQIQSTVRALKNGWRDKNNIVPVEIRQYYPIVVTLEEIPMNPLIHGEVSRWLDAHRLLQEPDVCPLQYFDAGVFDQIVGALQNGSSLKELLDEKLSSQSEVDDSWGNFLYRRQNHLKINDPYVEKRYEELKETAIRFFEQRRSV